MRKQDLSKLIGVLLLLLTFPSQTLAGTEGLKQEIDGYHIELVFATEQPQTGSNELTIKLHTPHGQPLDDAIVNVSVTRPDSTQPNDAIVDNHNQIQANNHDEASAVGPHEAESGAHGEAVAHDEANAANPHEAETEAHGEIVVHEAGSDSHGGASASDSHEAEGGHHDEVGNLVAQLTTGSAAGHYMGQVEFADTGAWLVKVNFMVEDEAKEANFVVEATRNASTWWVINSFLGINAVVIGVAAILKKKPVETRKGKGIS